MSPMTYHVAMCEPGVSAPLWLTNPLVISWNAVGGMCFLVEASSSDIEVEFIDDENVLVYSVV